MPAARTNRRAACDECRTRKLKCSGDVTGCLRCQNNALSCVYSAPNRMGRPPKRQKNYTQQLDVAQPADAPPNTFVSCSESNLVPGFSWCDSDIYMSEHVFAHSNTPDSQFRIDPSLAALTAVEPAVAHQDDTPIAAEATSNPMSHIDQDMTATSCSCLPNVYLTLANLKSTENNGFPFALGPVRAAMRTSYEMLVCNHCPKQAASAAQNLMFLASLLTTITLHFDRILRNIDIKSREAQDSNQKQSFRLGDDSLESMHLHTGTIDCPARFTIDLEPHMWSTLAKKVVQKEVLGTEKGSMTLQRLVQDLEERQRYWHTRLPLDCGIMQPESGSSSLPESEYGCLRMTRQIDETIKRLPW